MARKRSKAIMVYRRHSVQPKQWKKASWETQPAKDTVPLPSMSQAISLGTMTEDSTMSTIERWQRNQYIGLCKGASNATTNRIRPFPEIDNRYIRKKKKRSRIFRFGGYRKPKSSKFSNEVTFSHSVNKELNMVEQILGETLDTTCSKMGS